MTPAKNVFREISTPQRTSAVLLLVILAFFIVFDKAAYQSYFSDDDFSNLALARFVPWLKIPESIFSLTYIANIRPLGILYYKLLGSTAHFWFFPYLAVLQVLHVGTSILLWLFLRRLGLRPFAAALGCFFFALNPATLTAYWKPMYVFDVLCGFFVILSLVFYQRDRFLLSFLCAWLAFRGKEMELMLPLVLLAYEWTFGQRRWKPLVPFFLMSLSFGIQSLLIPQGPENAYSMNLTRAALWGGLLFYGTKLLYAPLSGLTVSIGLLFLRLRTVTLGVLGFWILLFPMLLFPGRQFGAYLYVPLLAFSLAIAGLAEWRPLWATIFLVIWLPASYEELRIERAPILAFGHEHRPYVTQVLASLKAHPETTGVVYDGSPTDFAVWGQEGLFPYALDKYGVIARSAGAPDAQEIARRPGTILFTWDAVKRQLVTDVYPGDGHEASYVDFAKAYPLWQLKQGWEGLGAGCRWMAPEAVIALRRPPEANGFMVRADAREGQTIRVASGGEPIGDYRFPHGGEQTVTWPITPAKSDLADYAISVTPPSRPSTYSDAPGIAVCACGFVHH